MVNARRALPAVVVIALLAGGCGRGAAPASETTATSGDVPVASLPQVDPAAILQHVKVISADPYQGRAPGGAGENLTVDYLQTQFRDMGLKPGNPDGTYVQKVPLVGITGAEAKPLTFTKGSKTLALAWKDDVVAWSKHVADSAAIANSDVVFAGYGVEAPEYGWDDFKGVDVKGKTIVVLINDPPVPDPADPSKLDPKMFGGRAMTYYGRWTYKFEEGARKGAAAVLIVHETEPAAYPFSVVQGNLGEKFDIIPPDRNMGRVNIEGWITVDSARKLFSMAGMDFDALKKQALTRSFKAVPLGVTASMAIHNTLRTIDSHNVVAKVEGTDASVKDEYVIYTAHWDHLGVGLPVNGDNIYNGARDNAAGVATMIEVARAFTKVRPQPRRSILFVMVTAEEQGLLGSQYYAVMPLHPLAKTLAEINVDEPNVYAPSKDVTVIGYGASDLDDYLRQAAREQGRTLRADPQPEKGFYYRSDHFNFAKQGVPSLYTESGVETAPSAGKPPDYLKSKLDDYEEHHYHQPSDEVKPDWDLSGTAQDAQLVLAVGYRVANAQKYPEWKPGNEFKTKRDSMVHK
ncbi:MAG TPA: M28 family metallopeptidase [Vicinamibacterales bacterium]|jgi:Zn-dependent M28 family amino/carboxypeptidase|nr:M28 family metallopeptidase [Vicinamibacterales bacterium]